MKKLFSSILTLALLAIAVTFAVPKAEAQLAIVVLIPGGTNNVSATTTAAYTTEYPFSATKSTQVAIQGTLKTISAMTENITFTFDGSVDNVSWEGSVATLTIPASSATELVTYGTNITVGARGFFRLSSINNQNSSAATNIALKVSTKTGL